MMKKIAAIFALLLTSNSYAYWAVVPKMGSLEMTCKYTEIKPEILLQFYDSYVSKRGYKVFNNRPYDYYADGYRGRYAITTYQKVGVRKIFVAIFEDKKPCLNLINNTI